MTLAAAYRVGRVPVLLSDTLVSGVGEKAHQPIATRVDLEEPLPSEWLVPVTGLSRKSVVIGGKLAVAAAGNGLGAAVVCSRLKTILGGHTLNAAMLSEALRSIDDARSEATSCTLVGWLGAVDECRSFSWDSRTPESIRWDEDFIAGSGEQLFRQLAWGSTQREMPVATLQPQRCNSDFPTGHPPPVLHKRGKSLTRARWHRYPTFTAAAVTRPTGVETVGIFLSCKRKRLSSNPTPSAPRSA